MLNIATVFCIIFSASSALGKSPGSKEQPSHVGKGRLEVLAYDYQRVFYHYLHVGACLSRIKKSEAKGFLDIEKCNTRATGKRVFHEFIDEKKGLLAVDSVESLFALGGLCDGVSASSLGLLKHGDCAMVQLAKETPFEDTTYTLVLYANIMLGIETIRTTQDDLAPRERHVSDVTYGALEIVAVTLFFNTTEARDAVKQRGLDKKSLAIQYETLASISSGLIRVKVASLSTSKSTFKTREFFLPTLPLVRDYLYEQEVHVDGMKAKDMARSVNVKDVSQIDKAYHLRYGIGGTVLRKDELWREVTVLEVQLAARQIRAKEERAHYCSKGRVKKTCARLEKLIKRIHDKPLPL